MNAAPLAQTGGLQRGAIGASLTLHGALAAAAILPFLNAAPLRPSAPAGLDVVWIAAAANQGAADADPTAGTALTETAPSVEEAPVPEPGSASVEPALSPVLAEAPARLEPAVPAPAVPVFAAAPPIEVPEQPTVAEAPAPPEPAIPAAPVLAAAPPAQAREPLPTTDASTPPELAPGAISTPVLPPALASSARPAPSPTRPAAPRPDRPAPVATRTATGAATTAGRGTEASTAAAATAITPVSLPVAAPPGPILVTAPRYRSPPAPPVYPPRAVEFGLTGTVLIRARVGADGSTEEIRLWRTSGHALLDAAALAAVRRWAFEPASQDGRRVEAWVEVPVHFRLN
jgi:protein TonB